MTGRTLLPAVILTAGSITALATIAGLLAGVGR
jgi:hypothetical protein